MTALSRPNAARRVSRHRFLATLLTISIVTVACNAAAPGGAVGSAPSAGGGDADPASIRLYTTISQDTVDAVNAAFATAHPDIAIELFRAPTGELNARLAAERREGRIRADVLWLTDPLSMQPYAADDLLRAWSPPAAEAIDVAYRSDDYWGARLLNMVIVSGDDVDPAPTDWDDLADPAYRGGVVLPDPGFAGSAFGALGYFALEEGYGAAHLQALSDNGAVQVQAPDEVVTGVAEGRYKVGMTLDYSVRQAIDRGSPVRMIWPESGAIAMYSPIAVLASTEAAESAETFVDFVLDVEGQQAIASTGWQPVRSDVEGPPVEGPQVTPDWDAAAEQRDQLLEEYRAIFGG
ncbi:MAG: extracellular solute-binding protein [Chloroflexi bacterium]|nr:extracellular solute-binding protein [Chloroflexota bacterium]